MDAYQNFFIDLISFRHTKEVFSIPYVTVPKDLTKVKTKVLFNLTKRQLICFSTGSLLGIPLYFFTKEPLGSSTAALLMILAMLPAFLLAMYEKNGQHLEVVIRNMIRVLALRPKKRPYKTNNFYAAIARQDQLDKEVYQIVHPKKAVPHSAKRGQDRNLKGKADR